MTLIREALVHLSARAVSAVLSSSVFALVARFNGAPDAKAVFFFMFATGFIAAFLRSFCLFSAGLRGGERRTARLRRMQALVRRYFRLAPLFALAIVAVLGFQNVPVWLLVTTALVLLGAGLDCDLLRAALGKGPLFSPIFASGNMVAVLWLLAMGGGFGVGSIAVLFPWITVAAYNAALLARLKGRRAVIRPPTTSHSAHHLPATLLTALYDGVVLNLPFLAGSGLSAAAGLDLSVALRLLSSAQPFFPLVNHWASSGRIYHLARRIRVSETGLYAVMLMLSGWAASPIFIVLYLAIGKSAVTLSQYVIFSLLLTAIGLYFGAARFATIALPAHLRVRQFAVGLGVYLTVWFLLTWIWGISASMAAALQVSALLNVAISTLWLARSRRPSH